MSLTRQQRRQQLLNELESVRHLLLEQDLAIAPPVLQQAIPTLEEPLNLLHGDNTLHAHSEQPHHPAARIAAESTSAAIAAPDAMQQLIAKLTQRHPPAVAPPARPPLAATNAVALATTTAATATMEPAPASAVENDGLPESTAGADAPTETAEDYLQSTLLFTAVADPQHYSEPHSLLLFQPVLDAPHFSAPCFTSLELTKPSFATTDAQVPATDKFAISEPHSETVAAVSAEDIEQLLFEIMPAVETLLRERLTALLLKAPQPTN